MPTDAELLERVGIALWGEQWQAPLARAVGLNDRTVRRYAAGERPVPTGLWLELHGIAVRRDSTLRGLLPELLSRLGRAGSSPAT